MELLDAVLEAGPKPPYTATRAEMKNYAQTLSSHVAISVADGLRRHGLDNCFPDKEGRGEDRAFLGSIGAKKVDVHFSTENGGLMLGVSIKTINYIPTSNLANRCGDLMFESVTLHGRFPFAVLGALLILDSKALSDGNDRRQSTFDQANTKLKLYSGRRYYSESIEKFEAISIGIYDVSSSTQYFRLFEVGNQPREIAENEFYSRLADLTKQRNPKHF